MLRCVVLCGLYGSYFRIFALTVILEVWSVYGIGRVWVGCGLVLTGCVAILCYRLLCYFVGMGFRVFSCFGVSIICCFGFVLSSHFLCGAFRFVNIV